MTDVSIRPYRMDDVDALFEAVHESVDAIFPWLPWCHPGYSRTEAVEWIGSREAGFESGSDFSFVVVDCNDRLLGGCGLNEIRRAHRLANLGYWVRGSEMGRGIAPAAVSLVTMFAFTETDLLRLEILCALENLRSQRVAEKSGAMREGVLRDRLLIHDRLHDAHLFSIVRSAWMPK